MIGNIERIAMMCALLAVFSSTRSVFAAESDPEVILRRIGIDQNIGAMLPLDVDLNDESGSRVQLRGYFGSRPVMLVFVYYGCPMLCTEVLNGVVKCLRVLPYNPGTEFEIVTISIDPSETPILASKKKAELLRSLGRPNAGGGWHFLTGEAAAISRLTAAAGFRYVHDPLTNQFAHASGIMLLTPKGVLSKYYYGIEYYPRDVRLGIDEASNGKVGSLADQVLLYCFRYDPMTGRYGLSILAILRGAGILTVFAIGGFMAVMFRREARAKHIIEPGRTAHRV